MENFMHLLLPNFAYIKQYRRAGAISLLEGLRRIAAGQMKEEKQVLFGVMVNFSGNRIATYLFKGITCAACKKRGSYFAVEKCRHDRGDTYHLNLWGIESSGRHFLMTSDHIIPKSKGGTGNIRNRQPMCVRCNTKKADLTPEQLAQKERNKQLATTTEGILQIKRERQEKNETIIQQLDGTVQS
jgi:hypothetical protein